jgi:pimeloyl-ACP methyl ester carboxylesterase
MPALTRIAAVAATMLFAACQSPPALRSEVRHMEVNGAQLAYVDDGRGAPVVFVHGALGDYRTWERQRAIVGQQYRVIAYSQRYFGTEPWGANWPKFGVPAHALDLAAFIRGLGAGPVHLVSWSYSGQTVLDVALKHPELVRSAFLFEPGEASYVINPADLQAIAEDQKAFGPAAQALQAGDPQKAVRLMLDTVAPRPNALDAWPPNVQAIVMDNLRTLPMQMGGQEPAPQITCAQLSTLKPPVAFVSGENTRVPFKIIGDAAVKCLPAAQRITVPKAGHLWPGDDPQGFSQTLVAFLNAK